MCMCVTKYDYDVVADYLAKPRRSSRITTNTHVCTEMGQTDMKDSEIC
jgi:hypothetical protein